MTPDPKFPISYVRGRFLDERKHNIPRKKVTKLFKADSTTRVNLSNGRFCKVAGGLLAFGGSYAIGWEVGNMICDKDLKETNLAIGAGLIGLAALLDGIGNKKIRKAVKRYNSLLNSGSYYFQLEGTPNGIGLVMYR